MGGPAILMWGGSQRMAAVGNVIIDCDCGIAFGIGSNRRGPFHLADGLIASNVIVRNAVDAGSDYGIAVANVKDVRVVHNTVFNAVRPGGVSWSLEYRFDCEKLLFANNLSLMRILEREGRHKDVRLAGNVVSRDAGLFRDVKRCDLHLAKSAKTARGAGVKLAADRLHAAVDVDGQPRPTDRPDVGADQAREANGE
jgi:hypothetical protein